MYYSHDKRYIYDGSFDVEWEEKEEKLFWRGITSGGVQTVDTWDKMHRHRLVQLTNSTHLRETDQEVSIIKPDTKKSSTKFEAYDRFLPAVYAEKYTDVGFSKLDWCVPNKNCDFLQPIFATKNSVSLAEQFKYKYIVDVDGHSFSGRWHAFLRSKSLGIKATIFREWHDSRLFAWKHFVPMDNSLRDLYTIMTYFTGLEKEDNVLETGPIPTTPEHGSHAQRIGMASREWANKVLRREDIEVSCFQSTKVRKVANIRHRFICSGYFWSMPVSWMTTETPLDLGSPAMPHEPYEVHDDSFAMKKIWTAWVLLNFLGLRHSSP